MVIDYLMAFPIIVAIVTHRRTASNLITAVMFICAEKVKYWLKKGSCSNNSRKSKNSNKTFMEIIQSYIKILTFAIIMAQPRAPALYISWIVIITGISRVYVFIFIYYIFMEINRNLIYKIKLIYK